MKDRKVVLTKQQVEDILNSLGGSETIPTIIKQFVLNQYKETK